VEVYGDVELQLLPPCTDLATAKAKLCLLFINLHAMKTYGGVEV
jgi:hypothetical protein